MSYFKFFPNIIYRGDERAQVLDSVDITVRAKILDYVKRSQISYLDYSIQDGERPEHLAERVYGRSDLHWTILLYNEIHDPYFEWPLSSSDLENMIENKYQGRAYFVDLEEASFKQRDFYFEPSNDQNTTNLFYQVGNGVVASLSVTILKWEPNLYKVVVSSDSPGVDVVPPSVDLSGVSRNILRQTRSDGKVVEAKVYRIVDKNRYAVRHFEKLDVEEIVDHHFVEAIEQVRKDLGVNPDFVNKSKNKSSNIERYIRGNELRPMPDGSIITAILNDEYEIRMNDRKRVIKMMRPEFTEAVSREIRKIFIE